VKKASGQTLLMESLPPQSLWSLSLNPSS